LAGIMFRCDYLSQILVIDVVGGEAAYESGTSETAIIAIISTPAT